ncbi:LysR family transcriptional regulator [Nocardiopsis dassonvillei]|uniref:Transcriptional regulator, LysR family n=1 Tax=Nocardiopsis dassonvillei (strain ATCC 23218 / DSM 43111 / CIP 107115 / JCM 7437 / KCTC 9190 / NBRC 14626 / NCTC 10488 / NRRL B-5397 / IMRU 509) TaxID=446468 RepID=D7AW20_NOCDD|nr:LysR family transcriptional regulator [Nocardiopsis dassonvillei]ADH69680.1 transcriptional regulator, LysR family [Nocardiopsis dassonvillei subsp. dassonvillei DSM 43111]NKY78130.1 LysR family transcriptional regulator [Nocardiopsis dassonvillei]VEI90193.1 Cyn operon transcriptional activator [Nocardiopsis dassonvillei]
MALSSDGIKLFLAVVDHGSFSGAARALRRVPSAVSMGIANIEAELGYPLFDRSRREAVPTPRALALVPHARSVASRLRLLQVHAVELSRDLESTLTVAVAAGVPDRDLLDALARVGGRYPLLRVNLLRAPQDGVREMLHRERADLALLAAAPDVDREEVFTNVTDEVFVAVVSATADTPGLPADLRRLEDLGASRQIVVAGPDDAVADRRLLVSDARWHVDSVEAALGLVERGAGWANLPLGKVREAVATGRVRVLEFVNLKNGLAMPVHLVWLRRRPLRRAAGEVVALMSRDHR